MKSIKLSFTRAATGKTRFSVFWLLVSAIVIINDTERREKERREKRNRQTKPPRKPPSGPKPF
jgi:hypothetical protein